MEKDEVNLELVKKLSDYFNSMADEKDETLVDKSFNLQTLLLLGAHYSKNPEALHIVGLLNSEPVVKGLELLGKELGKL